MRVCDFRAIRLAGCPRIYSTMVGGPIMVGRGRGWCTLAGGVLASQVTNSSQQVKSKIKSPVERTTPDHQCQTYETSQAAWSYVTECKQQHMVGRAHGPRIRYNGGWGQIMVGRGQGWGTWLRGSEQEVMSSGKTLWETLLWRRQLTMQNG